MFERTKVRTATVGGVTVELMWDNASAIDFGRELGLEKVNDIQTKLMNVIAEMQPDEDGSVSIQSVDAMTSMVWVAIQTAAEAKGQSPKVTKRVLKNALLSDQAGEIMNALVDCLVQFSPIEREEDEALGKSVEAGV